MKLFTLPATELLAICSSLLLLIALAAFYYVIIQPKQHDKIIRRRTATKEKIDDIFDEEDHFIATEIQGLRNN